MTRKREHVPMAEQLAAALSMLLFPHERDALRERKAAAKDVRAMFELHHVKLHAWGGEDRWWNLDWQAKAVHRELAKQDTARAAKAVRIDEKWRAFTRGMKPRRKPAARSRWPKRRRVR